MSVKEVAGELVRIAPHVKGVREGFDAAEAWRRAFVRVKHLNAAGGLQPLFPIERLQELKPFFEDKLTSEPRELAGDEFVEIFSKVLEKRMYPRSRIRQWFHDIDVDVSNSVSWDEFTSFMIYQATALGETNQRAREFVYEANPPIALAKEHKDVVCRVTSHQRCSFYISGALDGLLKWWRPSDAQCVRTVNNGDYAATKPAARSSGMHSYSSPIVDLVINLRGTSLYVCAADKSVNMYDPQTFALQRRYIGAPTSQFDALAKQDRMKVAATGADLVRALCREKEDNVETYTLKNMDESPTSMDLANPLGRELLLFGMSSGEIMMYPASKLGTNAEVLPLRVVRAHGTTITKLRYVRALEAIVTSSWDKTLRLTCPTTGRTLSVLDGGEHGEVRHAKSTTDFTFSHSMRLLASVGCDRNVLVWNPLMPTPLASLRGHTAMLQAICFDEADGHLVSLDTDNVVRVWDLRIYAPFQTITPGGCDTALAATTRFNTIMYDPHRSKLVCVGNKMTLWTVRRALSQFPATHLGHSDAPLNVVYIPTTNSLVSCDTNLIMSWDVADGSRRTLWDTECKDNTVCCTETDEAARRLLVAFKDGALRVYNYRNGQLLRATESPNARAEPIRVLHLTNRDMTSRAVVVVTPSEIIVYDELPGPSGSVSKRAESVFGAPDGSTLCSATLYPSPGNSTTSALVLGTTDGRIIVYSITTGTVTAMVTHPARLRTRQHSRRDGRYNPIVTSAESFLCGVADTGGDHSPGQPQLVRAAVEDIVYLADLDLFATVVGDSTIFFWDLRHASLKFTFATYLVPEECLLCIASNTPKGALAAPQHAAKMPAAPPPGKRKLVTACDNGFVYVRDISRLPTSRCPSHRFDASQLQLLHVFRAHNAPVTRLLLVGVLPKVIVTMSTADAFIKEFSLGGELIGYFGQVERWNVRRTETFGKDSRGRAAADRCVAPRPMTSGALRVGNSRQQDRLGSRGGGSPKVKQPQLLGRGKRGSTPGGANAPSAAATPFTAASFFERTNTNSKPPATSDAFMTQFISLPPLPVAGRASAAMPGVERRSLRVVPPGTPLSPRVEPDEDVGVLLSDSEPASSITSPLHRAGGEARELDAAASMRQLIYGKRRPAALAVGASAVAEASSLPPPAVSASSAAALPSSLPPLPSVSRTFRSTVAHGRFGDSSRLDHRQSANSPHVFDNLSPVPVARQALKPMLSAKYRRTGAALHKAVVQDATCAKPLTPAVLNPDSVRGAVKRKLSTKWSRRRLPSLAPRAATSLGSSGSTWQVPDEGRRRQSEGRSGNAARASAAAATAPSHSLLDANNDTSGPSPTFGSAEAAGLLRLQLLREKRGEAREGRLMRDAPALASKSSRIAHAMEVDPGGWVGRASSLLEMQRVDALQNPLAPKKKLREL